MFSVPTSTMPDILNNVGQLLTDLWLPFTLAIGIPLTFYVLYRITNAFLHGKTEDDFSIDDYEDI